MICEYIIKVDEDKKDIMGNCPLEEKPRELVRCKDCKHGIGDENVFVCRLKQLTAGVDWFCADGERR